MSTMEVQNPAWVNDKCGSSIKSSQISIWLNLAVQIETMPNIVYVFVKMRLVCTNGM